MNIRTIVTAVVAVLLALVAVLMVRSYLGAARPPGAPVQSGPGATAPVVVASAPIQRGAVHQPLQLKVVNYPADAVPSGSFQTVAQLTGGGANSHLALRPISLNEPLLADKVSGPGGKLTLSVALTPGMRAVSLRSGDVAGVAGFVLPGDRVDILLTRNIAGDANNAVTQVLAENVLVLGVDQSADDQQDKPVVAHTVTIEVTPDQAQTISLAQAVGNISLALRQVSDGAALNKKAMTVAQLGFFGGPRQGPAKAAESEKPRVPKGTNEVTVSRGTDVSTYAVTMR